MEALTLLQWTFDGLLGLGLLWLAWRALADPDLVKAIVLFVAFGLLMALAWVRLDAPDVALAEAAIGAGLTGALLLTACARLGPGQAEAAAGTPIRWTPSIRPYRGFLTAVLVLAATGLGYVVVSLPPHNPGLSTEVAGNLHASGVSNPVTAVLLNFRGYDTLLEVAVLLLALLGAWSLGGAPLPGEAAPGPVLETLSYLLAPVLILVSAYLLWAGAHAPGGAFQAGSVLGAAVVLLRLSGWRLGIESQAFHLRLLLVAGPVIFMAVAVVTIPLGGRFLEYPPEQAGLLILCIEAGATVSIGATLAALFVGGRTPEGENR